MEYLYESLGALALLVVKAALAFIPASVARKKGRNEALFFVYGFFLFLIALIHILILKPTPEAAAREEVKRRKIMVDEGGVPCPGCGEYMRPEIETCGLCGADMKAVPA